MFSDIGIDIGTYKTVVVKDKKIALTEPSVVVMDTYEDIPVSFGNSAFRAIGRSSERYEVVRPIERGVISNYDAAEYMLNNYISRTIANTMTKPRVITAVPSGCTKVEQMSIVDALQIAGCRSVCAVEAPIAAALGMDIDFSKPHGTTIVDIGAGTTDVAVLSLNGLAKCESARIAGNDIDDAIIRYMRREHNLLIGEHTANTLKHKIGSATTRKTEVGVFVKGLSLSTGMPDTIEVTSFEIQEAIDETLQQIMQAIQTVLNKTPPELVGDLTDDGIYITGGTSLLYGFTERIGNYLGVKVNTAPNCTTCVARGIIKLFKNYSVIKDGNYKFTTLDNMF